jgi:hypothetical protein
MAHRDDSAAARSASEDCERPNAKALAEDSRRALLRRRVRRIRRSVALFAAALFSAAFLMVYVQLASGHDPALVADARRAATHVIASGSTSGTRGKASSGQSGSSSRDTSATGAGASSSETEASTGTSTGGEESTSGSGESTAAGASETATPVTTSQS